MNFGPVCGPGSVSLIQVRSSGHCSIAGDDGTISGQKIVPAGVHANPSTASSVSSRSVSRCWIASATVIGSPTHVSAGLAALGEGPEALGAGDVTDALVGAAEGDRDGVGPGAQAATATTSSKGETRRSRIARA